LGLENYQVGFVVGHYKHLNLFLGVMVGVYSKLIAYVMLPI
jgi:hypothetical protein